MFDVIIVGGGAAGFYAAIQIAERSTDIKIGIFEPLKSSLVKLALNYLKHNIK